MAKVHSHTMSVYGIKQLCVCWHGNNLTTAAKNITSFSFAHCIPEPNLNFKVLIIT